MIAHNRITVVPSDIPQTAVASPSSLLECVHLVYGSRDVVKTFQRFAHKRLALTGRAAASVSDILRTEQNYECAVERLEELYGQQDVHARNHLTQLLNLPTVETLHVVNALRCLPYNNRQEQFMEALDITDICSDKLELPDEVAHLDRVTILQLADGTLSPTHEDRKDMEAHKRTGTYWSIVISGEGRKSSKSANRSEHRLWLGRTKPDCSGSLNSVSPWRPSYAPVWWSRGPACPTRYEPSGRRVSWHHND
ncbi:hypothetical protein MTO96_035639 [Rhipicephalus appendiculatus]